MIEQGQPLQRLHLGCGRNVLPGWLNLDHRPGEGVDVVANLDDCARTPLPFAPDAIDEIMGSHVLEHLNDPLPLMEELYRVAKAGTRATFYLPYGASDDAYEDPTHLRPYFINSFDYFAQPAYWKADYGYRGDWETERLILKVSAQKYQGYTPERLLDEVNTLRNVVKEMVAILVAVKPAREQRRELQTTTAIQLMLI